MNVLIDTCIIIDALQSREPFNKDAEAVFLAVANRRCVGFLTANSVTDIYYLMHKALHSSEETKKVGWALIEKELKKIPKDNVREICSKHIEEIKNSNSRDFRF